MTVHQADDRASTLGSAAEGGLWLCRQVGELMRVASDQHLGRRRGEIVGTFLNPRISGGAMTHYIVVLVPLAGGSWRAYFPDFHGCEVVGDHVEDVIDYSSRAATAMMGELQFTEASPPPRGVEEIRRWAAERSMDWTTAVVSCVQLPDLD